MADLTALQRDILFVLAGLDSPCGIEVKSELDETDVHDVLSGHLYESIDALVDAGYVEKSPRDGRTNEYYLTDEGREYVRRRVSWQREYVSDGTTAGAGSAGSTS